MERLHEIWKELHKNMVLKHLTVEQEEALVNEMDSLDPCGIAMLDHIREVDVDPVLHILGNEKAEYRELD